MAVQVKAAELVGRKGYTVTVPTWNGTVTVAPESETLRMVIGGREVVTFDWLAGGTAYLAPRVESVFLDPEEVVTLH